MPKKRTGKVLLIKPGSQSAIAASSSASRSHQDEPRASVNDRIRESRRQQSKNESVPNSSVTASVPPHVRAVLDLPLAAQPSPRPGARRGRTTATSGPSRIRAIPGPPPPKSWLIDSRYAPPSNADYRSLRAQEIKSILPGSVFPRSTSLQHSSLTELARNWDWHAEYDGFNMADLPTTLKEALLAYLAVYADNIRANPLRLLFLAEEDIQSRKEVTRLDLSGAIGNWTRLRQLEKDLVPSEPPRQYIAQDDVLEAWDAEPEETPRIAPTVNAGMVLTNLKHLSLAMRPNKSIAAATWGDLLRLTARLPTIVSLSLAHWPLPTYTPRAAATRVIVEAGPTPGTVVFGGRNMYSELDSDWREAAGILRSLSRKLPCLQWLDLTGCGEWLDAFTWEDPGNAEEGSDSRQVQGISESGADWAGSWRGVQKVIICIGWEPLRPKGLEDDYSAAHGGYGDFVRLHSSWNREKLEFEKLKRKQESFINHIRRLRREAGGGWIECEV